MQQPRKDVIGNYKIGKVLGKGAYGQVKLGIHLLTGRTVAIKIIQKRLQKSERALNRISREIEILKQVKHPNVMECYEVIETERSWYMITEYCSGGELFEYVSNKDKLDEAEAKEFFSQILSGLEYLHKMGICHRDLKLENLLLDVDNNLKIADFGMSCAYEQGQTLQTRCGSPHYISPEMLKGKGYEPIATDIWALGVTLYAMVQGYMPFDGDSDAELFENVMKGQYEEPLDLH